MSTEPSDVEQEVVLAGQDVPEASPKERRPRAATGGLVGVAVLAVLVSAATVYKFLEDPQWVKDAKAFLASLPKEKVVEHGGKKWLWAKGDTTIFEQAEWFDVTDAKIPPEQFEHGIGKDRIAAIDDAVFVAPTDRRLRDVEVGPDTLVIGYAHNGEAKAYPINVLVWHELANDTVGGKPVTVGY